MLTYAIVGCGCQVLVSSSVTFRRVFITHNNIAQNKKSNWLYQTPTFCSEEEQVSIVWVALGEMVGPFSGF